jgi:hypothetical protein
MSSIYVTLLQNATISTLPQIQTTTVPNGLGRVNASIILRGCWQAAVPAASLATTQSSKQINLIYVIEHFLSVCMAQMKMPSHPSVCPCLHFNNLFMQFIEYCP